MPVSLRTYVACAAAVLLTVGCASVTPEPETTVSQPPPAVTPPVTPRAAGPAAPPVVKTPAPSAPAPRPAAPPAAAPRAAAAASPAPAAPLTLDLAALKERLRATKAIGILTKISLKNKVDDLLDRFREHYRGKPTPTMAELRRSYDLMMMKVLSLLQDADQALAASIVSSREAIWGLLSDPEKFAALQS